ncbi:hypothetical protein GCM10020331_047350 [Ectobacillus funiculus]
MQKAGADIITVHVEACPHLHRTIQLIRSFGIKAGVVLNPHTPVSTIQHVLEDIDMVLLMTVNPGFGGQSFIHAVLPKKIQEVSRMVRERGLQVDIEVDGGVNAETARLCVEAGANVLVAGSAIYNEKKIVRRQFESFAENHKSYTQKKQLSCNRDSCFFVTL